MPFRTRLVGLFAALAVGLPLAAAAQASGALYGVTLDRVTKPERLAAALSALPERATTRIYFDTHEPASLYKPALTQLHPVSGIMGELLDSSQEKAISAEALKSRVEEYTAGLG